MLTKGAIGNLVNRYRAVLTKCNLINTFGSLAVASMLVLGGAGVAEAALATIDSYEGKNSITTDPATGTHEEGIVGGWFNKDSDDGITDISSTFSNFKAEGTNGIIVGGNFAKEGNIANLNGVIALSTNNIVENCTVEGLIGGNGAVSNTSTHFDKLSFYNTHDTNTIIKSGTFGLKPDGNSPESLIISGDMLKHGYSGGDGGWMSDIDNSALTIQGGTYNAAIIGGSAIIEFYGSPKKAMSAEVTKATTTITGGEFNHVIVGGGFTFGGGDSNTNATTYGKIKSSVTEVVINIDGSGNNLTINGDIYAGGMQGTGNTSITDTTYSYHDNTVDSASMNISNATVQNIYGTNAGMYASYENQNLWKEIFYVPLDGSNGTTAETVNTTLTFTNSTANEVYIPDGTVTLRSEKAGAVDIKTLLTVKNNKAITICADGETNDALDGDVNELKGLITVKEIKYLEPENPSETSSTDVFAGQEVTMEAGAATGEVTATFDEDGKMTSKTEKQNETNAAMSDLPTINLMLTRVEMNDLRKRMGDIRLLEGDSGVWTRWDGGRLKGDAGLTNDFHKIQIGADTLTGVEGLRLGAAFSYTNSDMDFAKASAESDTLSFAGYGVWTADNGMFADVIARVAFIDTEIQTDKVKGDIDNLALSLSGEFGWRFNFCDRFFVEPQVELTYTYINDDDFTSNGAKFEFDESDSLIGRAGVAAGWALPNDLGELYARASVVQEFMGDGELTVSSGSAVRHLKTDGDDTWFEYGIGANVKVNKNAYIFADVERTEGAEIEEEWRGTVGFRFSF